MATALSIENLSQPTKDSPDWGISSVDLLSLAFNTSVKPFIASVVSLKELPFFFFPPEWTDSAGRFSARLLLCLSIDVGSSSMSSGLTFTCTPSIGMKHRAFALCHYFELVGQKKFVGSPWQCWHWKVVPTTGSVQTSFFENPCIYSWPINNCIYWVKRMRYRFI